MNVQNDSFSRYISDPLNMEFSQKWKFRLTQLIVSVNQTQISCEWVTSAVDKSMMGQTSII